MDSKGSVATITLGMGRRVWNTTAIRVLFGAAVAVALVLAFTRLVDLGAIIQRLSHLNILLALLCGAAFLSAYIVRAMRWRVFLAPRRVPIIRIILVYQVATFLNWLLPVRGGELAKGLLLRQLDGIPLSESLPTIGMDKLMDLLPALVLILLTPFMPFALSGLLLALLIFVLLALAVIVGILALTLWRRELALKLIQAMLARLPEPIARRLTPFVMNFVDSLLALVMQPRLLAIGAAYTAGAVTLDSLFAFLAFAAIGAPIAFPVVLYGYTLFNLAFVLPTPPGQVGSNEVIGLLIFSGLFAINRNAVGAMFVFSHPFTALLMTAAGLVSLSALGLSFRSAIRLVGQQQPVATEASTPQ